jgi:hypothetical protein
MIDAMSGYGTFRTSRPHQMNVCLSQSSRHRFETPRTKRVLAPFRFKRDWEPASRYWGTVLSIPQRLCLNFAGAATAWQSVQTFVAVPQLFRACAKIFPNVGDRTDQFVLKCISFPRVWEMRISTYSVERPMCLTCKHRMGLARISPGKRGFEERTFECRTCHRLEKVSIAIDPLKTDAVGWLASELRPPR